MSGHSVILFHVTANLQKIAEETKKDELKLYYLNENWDKRMVQFVIKKLIQFIIN